MRKLVVLAVVALLVTTAGCSLFDSNDRRAPDGVDEADDAELLPGLTANGVTDRTKLAATHYDALEDETYRAEYRITVRNGSGSVVAAREHTQTVTDDATEVLIEADPEHVDGESNAMASGHSWSGDDGEYTRVVDGSGEVTYYPESYFRAADPGLPVGILTLFEAVEEVSVERDVATERYRLEGAGNRPSGGTLSFELLLSEDGHVEEYRIESRMPSEDEHQYVGSFERDGSRYFERRSVEPFEERTGIELEEPDWLGGRIELEEPEWLEEAKAELEQN